MNRTMIFMLASIFAFTAPVMAQTDQERERSTMQDIGGHFRHGHRDWSQQEGRHVHNVCWDWDAAQGWVWICR